MPTQNASNQSFSNQADGFTIGGGTTQRNLTVTGGSPTLSDSGNNTYTLPGSTDTLASLSATQTLTNKTISGYIEGVTAIGTVSSSYTLNISNGTVLTATLTASTACTFNMPTATAGQSFVLYLKQPSSTGNGSATFTGVKWNSVGVPTITTTAGKMDILTFASDGTNWYGSYSQGFTY